MSNIIDEMISSLIKGDGNWKNELAIMSKEEKQKALNEMIEGYLLLSPEEVLSIAYKEMEEDEEVINFIIDNDLERGLKPIEQMVAFEEFDSKCKNALECAAKELNILSKQLLSVVNNTNSKITKEMILASKHLIPGALNKEAIDKNDTPKTLKEAIKKYEGDVKMDKFLNEIKLNNRNNTVEFAPNSMEPILCKPEDFEGDLIYDQVPSGIIIEEGEDDMERIIAENKELEEISEYLKNMYEDEVEENESYIKRIRTEVRRRTERGEEYTIGSGNLFY